MSFFQKVPFDRLADRIILEPSTDPIDAPGKTRRLIPWRDGSFEAWCESYGDAEPRVFVLKLPGAGGRAERATTHPLEYWPGLPGEMWAVNPPGYGGSPGRARLANLPSVAEAAYRAVQHEAAGRPIVVLGNSLGCATALLVAARFDVAAVILRNAPPLREVIVGRFGPRTFGIGARLLARGVPEPLDSLCSAGRVRAPAIFVMSDADRIIPPPYQQQVIDAYAGPKRVLHLPEAGHATPLLPRDEPEYAKLLTWLREEAALG